MADASTTDVEEDTVSWSAALEEKFMVVLSLGRRAVEEGWSSSSVTGRHTEFLIRAFALLERNEFSSLVGEGLLFPPIAGVRSSI